MGKNIFSLIESRVTACEGKESLLATAGEMEVGDPENGEEIIETMGGSGHGVILVSKSVCKEVR